MQYYTGRLGFPVTFSWYPVDGKSTREPRSMFGIHPGVNRRGAIHRHRVARRAACVLVIALARLPDAS